MRFHDAGLPVDALHFLPMDDDTLRDRLLSDPRTAGLVFAGPVDAAADIDRLLAARDGPIVPLIVELTDVPGQAALTNAADLYRFGTERSLSVDTTASGGNASLFSMDDSG
jgi:RHH-type proline utilization regulon transcriptional repressor/proline dehydrogenase/delta 1-pyrroline-5-carboxylate dehydrogenase